MKTEKIYIVGTPSVGMALSHNIPDNVEYITLEQAKEIGIDERMIGLRPSIQPIALEPLTIFINDYFTPPPTRAQRRANERKNKKRK